jgi:hypothetical protein
MLRIRREADVADNTMGSQCRIKQVKQQWVSAKQTKCKIKTCFDQRETGSRRSIERPPSTHTYTRSSALIIVSIQCMEPNSSQLQVSKIKSIICTS